MCLPRNYGTYTHSATYGCSSASTAVSRCVGLKTIKLLMRSKAFSDTSGSKSFKVRLGLLGVFSNKLVP